MWRRNLIFCLLQRVWPRDERNGPKLVTRDSLPSQSEIEFLERSTLVVLGSHFYSQFSLYMICCLNILQEKSAFPTVVVNPDKYLLY